MRIIPAVPSSIVPIIPPPGEVGAIAIAAGPDGRFVDRKNPLRGDAALPQRSVGTRIIRPGGQQRKRNSHHHRERISRRRAEESKDWLIIEVTPEWAPIMRCFQYFTIGRSMQAFSEIRERKNDTGRFSPVVVSPFPMGRIVHKEIAGLKLFGFSLAGEESFLAAPEYNVCFDIGRAPREVMPIDNVCITHGHMDHAAGAAYYMSQRGFVGLAPGRIIVHRGLAQAFQRLMAVWSDIERHPSAGQILGVEHLEDVPLRRGLLVRPFDVNHAAFALGYSLIEKRHKLKAEFVGKSGPEIVALKSQGVPIDEHTEVSLLTCTGDTALGRFLDLSFVRETRVLAIECTFFDPDHRTRASQGRHIHVNDVPRILEAAPHAQVLLIHVTRRTDIRQAKRILSRVIRREDAERVSFLMDRPPMAQPTSDAADADYVEATGETSVAARNKPSTPQAAD